ncbi:MAG: DNA repair protein RadA [Bacteriovoracia bacterium]
MKNIFSCQNCGYQSPKWLGKCPDCNQWNTLVEEKQVDLPKSRHSTAATRQESGKQHSPQKVSEIVFENEQRFKTKFQEFDRVLGGGIVPGSLVLIGGDPGIGKSTILMQAIESKAGKILYVSGEESASQIKMRALRLGTNKNDDSFFVLAENEIELIIAAVEKLKPQVLVIDSIQTIFSNQITSAPGSVSQVRECTGKLMMLAKGLGIATFVVGHVTKDGAIAGPKVLEHMVDTVLYFEGSSNHVYRILRTVKNRFGSTNEIGVFEMVESGLREVSNPSELFLQERPEGLPGTVVVSSQEGSRPILVEIQALVSGSELGMPRRTTLGVDHNKVSLLVAVLEKRLGVALYGHDIFVNVAGGFKINEPSADLGICAALLSSFQNKPIDFKTIYCGEVGLGGEIRRVSQVETRLSEAEKLGFQRAFVPKGNLSQLSKKFKIEIIGIDNLNQLQN